MIYTDSGTELWCTVKKVNETMYMNNNHYHVCKCI